MGPPGENGLEGPKASIKKKKKKSHHGRALHTLANVLKYETEHDNESTDMRASVTVYLVAAVL